MIAGNLVKDPLYTLSYMFGDLHKLGYLAALLAPFGFLALLAPARLLLGAADPGHEPDRLARRRRPTIATITSC